MTIVWSGLSLGSLYAIVAVLFNVPLSMAGVFNFASSQPLMIGAFVGYVGFAEHDLATPVVILLGALAGGVVGYLTERLAVRPVSKDTGFAILITTVGASVALSGLAVVIWGSRSRSVPFPGRERSFDVLGGLLQPVDVTLGALAVMVTVGMHLISRRTPWGQAGRAATEDRDAACLRGVNVRAIGVAAFVVSGAIGGAVGPIAAAKTYASVDLGTTIMVFGFVALAIGGFGSYLGCLVGGLLTGLAQAHIDRYLGSSYSLLLLFGLVLAVLLTRPSGLFGAPVVRSV